MYHGHYTYANLSSASPLFLYNNTLPPCPVAIPGFAYNFAPQSDEAKITGGGFRLNWVVNETITEGGYWSGAQLNGTRWVKATFHDFASGQYTVLSFDAWGQEELGYFGVGS